ncbi:MAG TPA: hypothetical protein VN832_04665 [Stellaceae bacterium]|nr:hypothetical protein [Stellaceae bacterium]
MFRTVVDEPFLAALQPADAPAPLGPLADRSECLEQILGAFCDIADFDDIHQAAQRLILVQEWIRAEALRAAADPIFDD